MSAERSCDPESPLIRVRDVTKRYGARTVLRVPSFELRRGDRVLIVGPNGCGKSTLLRVLAGVATTSSGEVKRSTAYENLKVCYLPQAGGLHPNLTLADNFALWLRLLGSAEPADLTRQWYVRDFDLLPLLGIRCRDLSGGFQRLAALACVLATRPSGLFVDEPLSGIDGPHAQAMVEGLTGVAADLQFLAITSHAHDDFPSANRRLSLTEGLLS